MAFCFARYNVQQWQGMVQVATLPACARYRRNDLPALIPLHNCLQEMYHSFFHRDATRNMCSHRWNGHSMYPQYQMSAAYLHRSLGAMPKAAAMRGNVHHKHILLL